MVVLFYEDNGMCTRRVVIRAVACLWSFNNHPHLAGVGVLARRYVLSHIE